jgi:hypothetical protein
VGSRHTFLAVLLSSCGVVLTDGDDSHLTAHFCAVLYIATGVSKGDCYSHPVFTGVMQFKCLAPSLRWLNE